MSRSAAAQEPSMDEILASIRRIIETGDERDVGPISPVRVDRAGERERSAGGPDGTRAVDGPSARAEEGTGQPTASPLDATPTFSVGEEEELAARLREELEAVEIGDAPAAEAAPVEPANVVRDAEEAAVETFEVEPSQPAVQPGSSEPVSVLDADRGSAGASAPFVAANSDSRRMQEFRTAVLGDHASPTAEAGTGAPLVSGRTGELVGASFDELAQAIREGELRSLEDMAQDLLRPMLQDWLDDNLPKLVERLVREEIERVARGGRR